MGQKWKNQTSHPVASQLVTNQLVKNHQQENARTLPLCLVTILFSLLIALPMTLVKCRAMSHAQMDKTSWVKTERLVLQLSANARDQNASGPAPRARRLSTVKSSKNGCANKLATIFYFCNKF